MAGLELQILESLNQTRLRSQYGHEKDDHASKPVPWHEPTPCRHFCTREPEREECKHPLQSHNHGPSVNLISKWIKLYTDFWSTTIQFSLRFISRKLTALPANQISRWCSTPARNAGCTCLVWIPCRDTWKLYKPRKFQPQER